MLTINLRAGQTSQPYPMGIGSVASLSPVNGVSSWSGYFEYTTDTPERIQSGAATWATWPKGTVTSAQQSTVTVNMFARAVCVAGQLQAFFGDPTGSLVNTGIAWTDFDMATTPAGAAAGVYFPVFTWANRPLPASLYTGSVIRVSDVGGNTSTGGGNLFFSNSSRWKAIGGNILLDSVDTPNTTVANTSAQNLNPNAIVIPANVIGVFDRIRVRASFSKSSTTDTSTIVFRFGTALTTADAAIATVSTLATTNQTLGVLLDFKFPSATTIQKLGNASTDASYGGANANTYPAAVTISNITTSNLYMSIWSTMTGGTETVTLQDYTLEFFPTDSA